MIISKSFEFCYGHRVWNQELLSGECKCKHLHGHTGKVDIVLESDKLVRGMVLDFNELRVVKEFIDRFVDHKFLMDASDPLLHKWLFCNDKLELVEEGSSGCKTVLYGGRDSIDKEFFESLIILPFVPTSENLALWLFGVTNYFIKLIGSQVGCQALVKTVRWWESNKSFSEV